MGYGAGVYFLSTGGTIMPVKQLPLIGEQGIWGVKDTGSTSATYRYYLNGYFEKTQSQEQGREWAFCKRPGLSDAYATGFTAGHYILGFISSVDRTTQIVFTSNGSNANRTWYISNGSVTDRGAPPALVGNWSYTRPVVIARLDGISYGAVAGVAPISSITRAAQIATVVTSSPHGLVTGNYVTVSGCTQTEYNITAQITVSAADTFVYTISGAPATPATGSPAYSVEKAYYVATDFSKMALISSTGIWMEVTDPDLTGLNQCTNIIPMDGYLFVGTTDNRIYNSDLNTSITWTSTSFLTAADVPGRLLWLSRIRNFLIAFKDKSIEFFEDVGNPTPGSPLEARKSLNSRIGLLNRNTIQEVSDGIIFAGVSETGSVKMYKISNENLSITPISNRYVEQLLPRLRVETSTTSYSVDPVFSSALIGQSQAFNLMGKEFYGISLADPTASNSQPAMQVYDNTLKIWTTWTTAISTTGTQDTRGFHGTQAQTIVTVLDSLAQVAFVDNTGVPGGGSARILTVKLVTPVFYDLDNDGSTQNIYPFSWTSDQFDFGSRKRKFMDAVEIHYTGDQTATPSNAAATVLTLYYRNTDYSTASGHAVSRSLYYDPGGGTRCIARRLGSFRRRSFTITLSAAVNMRLWAVEVTYNQGEQDQEG